MKEAKKKIPQTIIACLLISAAYIVLAVQPLTSELHFTPEWSIETDSPSSKAKQDDILIPYKLGQNAGYFTPDGRIVHSVSFPFKTSITDSCYTTYTNGSESFTVYDTDGNPQFQVNEYGFPFLQDDRVYLMLPGGNALAQYDRNGNQLWQYESYAPITAFNSSQEGCIAGLADGTLIVFNNEGKKCMDYVPGGSTTNIILGADISDDGKTVACITGQGQQRLVVSHFDQDTIHTIYHRYFDTDLQRQTMVKFEGDNIYFNYNGGLGVVDYKKLKEYHMPMQGTVIQIEPSPVRKIVYVLSRSGDQFTVTVVEGKNRVAGSFSFQASSAFIQVYEDALFVGRDSTICKMTVSRK